jgi:hypothetical protein
MENRHTMSDVAPAPDPWVVFDYEADMFFAMCNLLRQGNQEYAALSRPIQNAVVESALLHARQLIDILLSPGKFSDDINLSRLLPGFQPARLDELQRSYDSRSVDSPWWTLNKRLAHATSHRGSSHDYTNLLNQLAPVLSTHIPHPPERV